MDSIAIGYLVTCSVDIYFNVDVVLSTVNSPEKSICLSARICLAHILYPAPTWCHVFIISG